MNSIAKTPAARWREKGEPDPHAGNYDCERAALAMGDMTDDELANAVYMLGDAKPGIQALKDGALPSIAYLTAAKDRIRWLSRALEDAAKQASPSLAVSIADDIVRSDIECFAVCGRIEENGGYPIYSLTETPPVIAEGDPGLVRTHDDAIEELRVVQRAAKYIRERGNVFDWRMVDVEGYPGYVRFIDKEGRPIDPGAPA